uniref:DEP domain-containing protein n=1 Tax=Macrostomum lignano TaxID=282301 RepID=A0A1I8FE94_9PLAT
VQGRIFALAAVFVAASVWTLLLSLCHLAAGSAAGREAADRPALDSRRLWKFLSHAPRNLCSNSANFAHRWLARYCGGGGGGAVWRSALVHAGLLNGHRICQTDAIPRPSFRVGHHTSAKAVEELVMACRRGQAGPGVPGASARAGSGGGSGREAAGRAAVQLTCRAEPSSIGGGAPLAGSADDRGRKYGKPAIPTCDDNLSLARPAGRNFFGDNRRAAIEQADLQTAWASRLLHEGDSAMTRALTTQLAASIERNLHEPVRTLGVFVRPTADPLRSANRQSTDINRGGGRSKVSKGELDSRNVGRGLAPSPKESRASPAAQAAELRPGHLAAATEKRLLLPVEPRILRVELDDGIPREVSGRTLATTVWPRKRAVAACAQPGCCGWETGLTACTLSHSAWCNCSMPVQTRQSKGALRSAACKVQGRLHRVPTHRRRRIRSCCVATTPKASCSATLAAQRQHAAKPDLRELGKSVESWSGS